MILSIERVGKRVFQNISYTPINHLKWLPFQRALSTTFQTPFRLGSHIDNIEDTSIPYVLIETSFLTKFNKPSLSINALHEIEEIIRNKGAVPISLGMINGNIMVGLTDEEVQKLCTENKRGICCNKSNIAHFTTQNTTAFISPSAAIHISQIYNIPTVMSSELACIDLYSSDTSSIHSDLASLHDTNSILVSSGFHPYQDIPRSLSYLQSKHINIITYNSNYIPSTLGCQSMITSPCSINDEIQLIQKLQDQHQHHIPCLLFSGITASIHQEDIQQELAVARRKAEEKKVPANSLYRYIQKELYRSKSIDAKSAVNEILQRNARLAAKIACTFVTPSNSLNPTKFSSNSVRTNLQPTSPTYSIYCIGSKENKELGITSRIIEIMKNRDIDSNSDDRKVNEVIDDVMHTMVHSKMNYNSKDKDLWETVIGNLYKKFQFDNVITNPLPPLLQSKQGSPVFITSSYYSSIIQLTSSSSLAHHHHPSIVNASHLLYLIFTSLTREAPPFHITIRGTDKMAEEMTDFARIIGDPENGTTFVNTIKTPELSQVYNTQGILIKTFVDNDMMNHIGCEYIKKHNEMIKKAPIIVTDGGMNKESMDYIVKMSKTYGIPLFSDFSDVTQFGPILRSNLLKVSDWFVLNDIGIISLLQELGKSEEKEEWLKILNNTSTTGNKVRNLIERFCQIIKNHVQIEPDKAHTILMSLNNWGQWNVSLQHNHIEITWLKSSESGVYMNAAFESGYLWGLMNQYPLDLSMSLGFIVQKEVERNQCLFSRNLTSACFANQIMKYMTGISSNDFF